MKRISSYSSRKKIGWQLRIVADPQPGLVDRAHVAAGAEGAVAGAANGDGTHSRVRSPSPHSRIDTPVVVEGQRVERPWSVDDQRGKAALSADQDLAVAAHRSGAEQAPGDDHPHDLVGAFEDLVHAHVAQIALDREILEVAVAADAAAAPRWQTWKPGIGREALGHRAMHRRLGSPRSRLAAPRHSISRAASSSVAMSASLNCSAWKSARRLAELAALEHVVARRLEAGARAAQRAGADMLRRPPSSPIIAIAKPSPSAPRRLATGTRQSSKITIAVGWVFQPSFFSCLPKDEARRALLDDEAGDALWPGARRCAPSPT